MGSALSTQQPGPGELPTANATAALAYYKQAADVQNANYQKGLDAFNAEIGTAQNQVTQGTDAANLQLAPILSKAEQANNEIMKLTGQTPYTPSLKIAQQMGTLGLGTYQDQINQMLAAENIKDPSQRAAAKDQLMQQVSGLATQDPYAAQVASQADWSSADPTFLNYMMGANSGGLGFSGLAYDRARGALDNYFGKIKEGQGDLSAVGLGPTYPGASGDMQGPQKAIDMLNGVYGPEVQRIYQSAGAETANSLMQSGGNFVDPLASGGSMSGNYNKDAYAAIAKSATDYRDKYLSDSSSLRSQQTDYLKNRDTFSNLANTWASNYSNDAPAPYTSDQISQIMEGIPGYEQAQQDQSKAISRQYAARGMLGSGNTLLSLQQSSQDLSSQTFQGYLNSLQNIVNQGTGATLQTAANQVNNGVYNAGLTQQAGQAQMSTQQSIGQNTANSLYQQGDTTYDLNKFNTNIKFMDYLQQMQNSAAIQQSALSSAAGIGQAGLAQSQFNYGQAQSANTGSGFAMGSV